MELLLQSVTDAFDPLEIVLPRLGHDVTGELHHRLRPSAVGSNFKRVLAL